MSENLLLCLNQSDITLPYIFKQTGTKVYSFEEALYYFNLNWKYSLEDVLSEEFIFWVSDILEQSYIATKIININKIENAKDQIISFLNIIEYFSKSQIDSTKKEIKEWFNRLEWERIKTIGDFFFNNSEYTKALKEYKKALEKEENFIIYNNIGLTYSKLNDMDRALFYFEKSYSLDSNNQVVIFNFAECLALNKDFEKANIFIENLESDEEKFYLKGLSYKHKNDFENAAHYFEKAFKENGSDENLMEVILIYITLKKFSDAQELLEKLSKKTSFYYLTKGEIYFLLNNFESAYEIILDGINENEKEISYYVKLSEYYRLTRKLELAEEIIEKGFKIESENKELLIEKAKLSKAEGKLKDFQFIIKNLLNRFKMEYRNIH